MTRVSGHGLQREGRAHDEHGRYAGYSYAPGSALCECGWMSEPCGTDAERKRRHVAHKAEVLKERGAS